MSYRDGEAVPIRPALPLVLLLYALMPDKAWADDTSPAGFDAQTLHQRGIDPQLASLLLATPRFAAGRHSVNLRVNGLRRGRLEVSFDQQGTPCLDRALLDAANLVIPADPVGCEDFLVRYPQSLVEPDPSTLTLALVVPTEALRPVQQDISGYQTGGVAGVLNYDLSGVYNRFGGDAPRVG
ncbi:outer membrane usher protein, partial [Pseudomonas carnis]|uniref:FimD/PapC N-terminal domain-containing protein n=1 Tax=Pseudomonas carnis TaxID=2487355 RepID=UPI0023516A24